MNDARDVYVNDLEKAKELYFRYDGSRFFMSRDGVDHLYQQAAVPEEVEEQWLVELTAKKLEMLAAPGNWKAVQFLSHHGDFRHAARLAGTKPLGQIWERVTYLEELLNYARSFRKLYGKPLSEQDAIMDAAERYGREWMESADDESLRRRLQQVLDETARHRVPENVRPLPEGASRPGSTKKTASKAARIDKLCNAFYPASALDHAEEKSGKRKQEGAWIGGRLIINDRCLSFAPSRMKDASSAHVQAVEIPFDQVKAVSKEFGLMTGIVTIEHDGGIFMFRCFGAKRIAQQLIALTGKN